MAEPHSPINRWLSRIKTLSRRNPLIKLGVHHFLRQTASGKSRVHLRLEADGSAVMLVNASRIYHLNPTAATMALFYLEGKPSDNVIQTLTQYFNVPITQAQQDHTRFIAQFEQLIAPDGACPLCDLDLNITAPFNAEPSAPYRADLALTYRCNNTCAHCYNDPTRRGMEMTTEEWKRVIDRCWDIGIPHVVFTGGEPTLRQDLAELVAYAEAKGQISGLNTNGRCLRDADLVRRLVDAGLDHVQITLESNLPAIHDQIVGVRGAWEDTLCGLRNVLDTSLFVMTNTTLLRQNGALLPDLLDLLSQLGVPTFGLNALIYSGRGASVGTGISEQELPGLLTYARQHTLAHGQRLIWYTPTQYCHFDPVLLDLGVKGCTAALYNLCIEPDGMVIPCQSYYHPLGHFLEDSWESVWNHPLALQLRQRRDLPPSCRACGLVQECGGGCPLHRLEANPPHPFQGDFAFPITHEPSEFNPNLHI